MKKITITVAGEPGSGQSTIAEAIRRHLTQVLETGFDDNAVTLTSSEPDLSKLTRVGLNKRIENLDVSVNIVEQQLAKAPAEPKAKKHIGSPQLAEAGQTLGAPYAEWPAWCEAFHERAAYQQRLADARHLLKQSMQDVLPVMNAMGWFFDDSRWHKLPASDDGPLSFLTAEERQNILAFIEQDILGNVGRRLSRDEDARLSVINPDEEAELPWRHAATVNVNVPASKVREILAEQLRTQLEDVEAVMAGLQPKAEVR